MRPLLFSCIMMLLVHHTDASDTLSCRVTNQLWDTLGIEQVCGNKPTIFILLSGTSCTGCKRSLAEFLSSIDTTRIKLAAIYRCSSSNLARRQSKLATMENFPMISEVYFDLSDLSATEITNLSGSVWKYCTITTEPGLFLFNPLKKETQCFGGNCLFSGMNLMSNTKAQIERFIATATRKH